MAQVKHNATLEDKVNTVEFWNMDEAGNDVPFDTDTTLYIEELDGTSVGTITPTLVGNHFAAIVDLSSVTDADTDYDDPVYKHMYSLRSSNRVYVYGKLNIVKIA